MARLTLAQAKASRIPQVLGLNPESPAFVAILNEATQRLLSRGTWVGTYGRYRICTFNGCLTWPRQFETIEAVALCDVALVIRNQWFEFMEQGAGLQGGNCNCDGGWQLFDRGNVCTFDDIRGTGKQVRVYADVAEDADAKILLLGYDDDGNWIRTFVDGVWIDGEQVAVSTTPVNSTKNFSSLVNVQKPVTNGSVRLYEFNTDDSTQRALAVYEPDETLPSYRRSYVGGISNLNNCGCVPNTDPDSCSQKTVTVMAKLAFIPVVNDTDYLLIGNVPALKEMCRAVRFGEQDSPLAMQQAQTAEARAIAEVNAELVSWLGSGTRISVQVDNAPGMIQPVESII